jgi:hypothetical protein
MIYGLIVSEYRIMMSILAGLSFVCFVAHSRHSHSLRKKTMSKQAKKVAIITGASRGIGAAIAERLANDGFAVVINYASSAGEADALVAKLQAAQHEAIAVKADVANSADVRRLFDETEQKLGKVDVLINNAGILQMAALADTSDELFERWWPCGEFFQHHGGDEFA